MQGRRSFAPVTQGMLWGPDSMLPCRVRSFVPVTTMGVKYGKLAGPKVLLPRRGESFAPVTTEGIGCGTKFPRTGHHKGGWVRYMPFVRFAKHLPLRCAAGGKGHALLSTKSLHPCTVAHFYARPLRPARSSAPRGSAPTARLPAAPPGSLSRPCLPTGLPSLPSPAAP